MTTIGAASSVAPKPHDQKPATFFWKIFFRKHYDQKPATFSGRFCFENPTIRTCNFFQNIFFCMSVPKPLDQRPFLDILAFQIQNLRNFFSKIFFINLTIKTCNFKDFLQKTSRSETCNFFLKTFFRKPHNPKQAMLKSFFRKPQDQKPTTFSKRFPVENSHSL